MRPIKIGAEAGGLTIVEGGLEAGDIVTTSNEYRLHDGVKIKATEGPQ
jgi:hypothetical protein